jgi:putative ABC transport system ATP-binding protein
MIRLVGITKTYVLAQARVPALRGVDLSINAGEFVAIMGASGSGKSTLMNIVGCLDKPTSGEYFLDNVAVGGLNRNQLADIRNEKIGFVFQGFNLLSRTSATENVELPVLYSRRREKRDAGAKALAALGEVGLSDRVHHEPTQLSGGQQQRIAIARALINNPRLILADEPTGNLDSVTSVEIMRIFQDLNDRGITVVLVTHEPDIAGHAKRLIEMRDGAIVADVSVTGRRSARSPAAA